MGLLDTARQRRTLVLVGAYEDLVRDTVEAVLEPGRALTLQQIVKSVAPQLFLQAGWPGVPPLTMIALVLEANPERFVEVTPGTSARRSAGRGDGPDAGVPSKPPWPLLAGGAAAAAVPPEKLSSLDAVSRVGAHVAVEEEMPRQRQRPGHNPTNPRTMRSATPAGATPTALTTLTPIA